MLSSRRYIATAPCLASRIGNMRNTLALETQRGPMRRDAHQIAAIQQRDIQDRRFDSTSWRGIGLAAVASAVAGALSVARNGSCEHAPARVVYLPSSVLPTLLRTIGAPLRAAALVTAVFPVGGAAAPGWLTGCFDPRYVFVIRYAAAEVFVASIGRRAASSGLAAFPAFAAGFGCRDRRLTRRRCRRRFIRPTAARPAKKNRSSR